MRYQMLWIDDDTDFLREMADYYGNQYDVHTAASLSDGIQQLHQHPIDLVLLDLEIGNDSGLEGLSVIREEAPSADIVMVSGHRDSRQIVEAVRAGAADYLCKPFSPEELDAVVEKLSAVKSIRDRHDALVANLNPSSGSRRFIGSSPAFRDVLTQAERLRGYPANVLVFGESGSGKELLARHIHNLENNEKRPFIAVNCAAIPEGLIESELFGHEKGSFTGATARKLGKFELANGGDIFLDEISSLRPDLQAKILRVLQEKEIVRVGGTGSIKVDFRVIAATNEPLENLVDGGTFRMDLYHRLCVIQIKIPALRDRIEDLPMLVAHFLEKHCKVNEHKRITGEALRALQEYRWAGNVRELENVIQSLVILSPDEIIDVHCLPQWLNDKQAPNQRFSHTFPEVNWGRPESVPSLKHYVRSMEKTFIEHILDLHEGDKTATATTLKVGRTTLYSKLKELGLME